MKNLYKEWVFQQICDCFLISLDQDLNVGEQCKIDIDSCLTGKVVHQNM